MSERRSYLVWAANQSEYGGGPFKFDGPLDEFIADLMQVREGIPEEYRASARCVISTEDDFDSRVASIEIRYHRAETDEEMATRQERERYNAKLEAVAREAKERVLYDELKRKYGA